MRLMDSWDFKAKKREYVYRLGTWRVNKNAASKNAARRSRGQFSDLDELHLCLYPLQASDSYRKQVETMGDGEQVLSLLFCCARAVEAGAQSRELVEHIERRLRKANAGDDDEVCSFLHILRGYILHRAGQAPQDVQLAVENGVHFLMNNCCTGDAKPKGQKPYVIDIPKLMLFCYGMATCNVDPDLQGEKLLGFHLSRLSGPGNESVCEFTLKKRLEWCCRKLRSPAARDFSLEILRTPCDGVDSGSLKKAVAYIFCFFLSQYVNEPEDAEAVSRSVNQGLRLSVCDLLYTLSALILDGLSLVPHLDLERLCDSPVELMEAARQRAEKVAEGLPTHHHLLVFFIETYRNLTLPTVYSFEEKRFMHQVCESTETLIRNLKGPGKTRDEEGGLEFLHQDMCDDVGEFMGDSVL